MQLRITDERANKYDAIACRSMKDDASGWAAFIVESVADRTDMLAEIEKLTAARDMAIKALSECSRSHGLEMGTLQSQLDESRREVSRLWTALHDIGWGTWGKSQRNAIGTARGKARAAIATKLEDTNDKPTLLARLKGTEPTAETKAAMDGIRKHRTPTQAELDRAATL